MATPDRPQRSQAGRTTTLTIDPWMEEAQRDSQLRAISFVLAAALLAPAFFLKLDVWKPITLEAPAKKTVFVVQTPRFRRKPEPEPVLPRETKRRLVPIPDPTPDDPEPLRLVAPLEIEPVDFDDAIPFDFPTAPPEPPQLAQPAVDTGPLEIGGDISRPVQVYAPSPRYTEIARRARRQGVVRLKAVIDESGRIENLELVSGLGFGLDEAALEAVRTWRFEPSRRKGQPVRVNYFMNIEYSLN